MLKIASLTAGIRFRLKDMQGVAISDFEIAEAINSAAALMFERLADNACAISNKKRILIVEGSAMLPMDFYRIRSLTSPNCGVCVPGEYRIVGDELFAPNDDYVLEYSYVPERADDPGDFIDAPEALRGALVEAAVAFVKGDIAGAEAIATETARRFAGAHVSHMPDMGPVEIWGGKG